MFRLTIISHSPHLNNLSLCFATLDSLFKFVSLSFADDHAHDIQCDYLISEVNV